jgi:hypothetical protein
MSSLKNAASLILSSYIRGQFGMPVLDEADVRLLLINLPRFLYWPVSGMCRIIFSLLYVLVPEIH